MRSCSTEGAFEVWRSQQSGKIWLWYGSFFVFCAGGVANCDDQGCEYRQISARV
jgi:hypothetical protein